jgi:hypothetical protein
METEMAPIYEGTASTYGEYIPALVRPGFIAALLVSVIALIAWWAA